MHARRTFVCVLAMGALLAAIIAPALAEDAAKKAAEKVITPVSAKASTDNWGNLPASNLLSWGNMTSGLAASPDLAATYDDDSEGKDAWMTKPGNVVGAWIQFDLGAPTDVDKAYVWQYNQGVYGVVRGVKDFKIEGSTDRATWKVLTATNTVKMKTHGGEGNSVAADQFALTQNNTGVQYIKFTIVSNNGDVTPLDEQHPKVVGLVGLGEVRFSAVPKK